MTRINKRRRRKRYRAYARGGETTGGAIPAPDRTHIDAYPITGMPGYQSLAAEVRATGRIALPGWHLDHDQGSAWSCVGHACALERAITNSAQAAAYGDTSPRRYDPIWLWNEAKLIDGLPGTPNDRLAGTTLRAAFDVLRAQGAKTCTDTWVTASGDVQVADSQGPFIEEGILRNRWCTTVAEIRACIFQGLPAVILVPWYETFDHPFAFGPGFWLPAGPPLGALRFWHSVLIIAAHDFRQAFQIKNSWGDEYPLAYLPYTLMTWLLGQGAEAAVVTDR